MLGPMLLVAKRRRTALHVPLLPLLAAGASGATAARDLASDRTDAAALATLLAGGMLLYALVTSRLLRARAHTLVVRSVRDAMTFDARAAAFGVSTGERPRLGAAYTLYVTDGMRRSDVATYASRRSLADASRLTEAFAVANRGGSAEARGLVTREIETWKAREDEARRHVGAYYASALWKSMPRVLGFALYVAITGALLYLGN
jgi:hypothetical protein